MDIDTIKLDDAAIFVAIAENLSSNGQIPAIFDQIPTILSQYRNLSFTNKENLLKLLLVFTFPTSTPAKKLVDWIDALLAQNDNSGADSAVDLLEVAHSISDQVPQNSQVLLQTAHDLLSSVNEDARLFNFPGSDGNILFDFVKSKLLHWCKYTSRISDFAPFFNLVESYQPFELWYNGIIVPYANYETLYLEKTQPDASLQNYLSCTNFSDQFNILIAPLDSSNSLSVTKWMDSVIFPLIKFHNYNVDPLLAWMFCPQIGKPSKKYALWHDILKAFVQSANFEYHHYKEVVKCYLASVYYYSYQETSGKIASIEITKIYDSIKATLSLFELGTPIEINIPQSVPTFLTFEEFLMDSNNPLKSLFEPTVDCLATLNQIINTCQKLFASNKLTIKEYLSLKCASTRDKEREISTCFSNITKSNWTQFLDSINLIISTFVSEEEKARINALVIERLLFINLFEVVEKLQESDTFEIDDETYYQLLLSKFWDSFNSANNLNDKIGHLKDATECITLFDSANLVQSQRDEIIRIKHLLKSIHNMKNFKIVMEKNVPFTPSKLKDLKENPLQLITIILEQNPKSYLAFEKLYKILNDMTLYFEIEESQFHKLKTACIESALIDGNFQFAYKQTIELLEHYNAQDLDENWLTFYQVGKYINPNWFDEDSTEKLEILQKQREILAKTLLIMSPRNENTKIVLNQWTLVNNQINEFYSYDELMKITDVKFKNTRKFSGADMKEIGDLANNIINDTTATGAHASEKISNLLVSGLGWAIGANQRP